MFAISLTTTVTALMKPESQKQLLCLQFVFLIARYISDKWLKDHCTGFLRSPLKQQIGAFGISVCQS